MSQILPKTSSTILVIALFISSSIALAQPQPPRESPNRRSDQAKPAEKRVQLRIIGHPEDLQNKKVLAEAIQLQIEATEAVQAKGEDQQAKIMVLQLKGDQLIQPQVVRKNGTIIITIPDPTKLGSGQKTPQVRILRLHTEAGDKPQVKKTQPPPRIRIERRIESHHEHAEHHHEHADKPAPKEEHRRIIVLSSKDVNNKTQNEVRGVFVPATGQKETIRRTMQIVPNEKGKTYRYVVPNTAKKANNQTLEQRLDRVEKQLAELKAILQANQSGGKK